MKAPTSGKERKKWRTRQAAHYGVTVTVTVFEVMVLVPLMYCATIVVGPAVVKDCTHIGVTPF